MVFDSQDADLANRALGDIKFDIIVDDGNHDDWPQYRTFKSLAPRHLSARGVYVIEDIYGFDHGYYTRYGMRSCLHQDRSVEKIAFIYPPQSKAKTTKLGLLSAGSGPEAAYGKVPDW